MAKSKSQQATSLAKQYTADQLAAAMIYGETRAGVDAKGNMSDQLAGVRELRTADNRARATGKDISGILTQPKQFQGLNPQSLQAIANPDSLKNPGDRAAARAALDKARDYFAGKYEGQVGKGTPYENVTSFNQASEAYNTKKSGAVPGSHVAGGAHNFFTTTDMAKRLLQARANAPEAMPIQTPSVAETSGKGAVLTTPAGTSVTPPATEISAGQLAQGSNPFIRDLGPMGQKDDESSDYGGRNPAFFGTGKATPLYQVPKLDPYQGTTLGAGNVAGISQYPYSSPNKSIGEGTGPGQGQGTGQGGGSSGGAGSGSDGGAGAGAGIGDGTIAGGGFGSSDDGAGQGAGQEQGQSAGAIGGQGAGQSQGAGTNGLPSGYGDGTIGGGGYTDYGPSQLPPDQPPQQGPAEITQEQPQTPSSSGKPNDTSGFNLGDIPSDYGSQYGGLPGAGGQDMGQSGAPADNQQTGTGTDPGVGDTGPTQQWGNQELGPSGEDQAPPPPGAGLNPDAINPAAPEQTPTPQVPTDYEADDQPATGLPDISLDPNEQLPPVYNEGDQIAQNNNSNTQVASLDTTTSDAGPGYVVPDYTGPAISEEKPSWFNPPSTEPPPAYEPPPSYDVPDDSPPPSAPSSGTTDYYTPWTPEVNLGPDTSSYYTPLETSSASVDTSSYYTPLEISTYNDSSSSGGWDPGAAIAAWDSGGIYASGGRIGSCVSEAMKRTRKYARGGSVAKSARMVLSKKA